MVQVYDVTSGTMLFEFVAESGRKQVLWSSDGSEFMTAAGDRAFLRDGNTGAVMHTFTFPDTNRRTLTGIAWAETHQRLYGALDVDRELLVWDTNTGNLLPSIELPFVSWGPQINHVGDLLAIGSNE